ncbi:MAG TPA: molybdopterin-dependent oxidoreductase [Silvibacterium sp.]|nr:molybdopterin-dependent oxidoreductase [Silvibacterium sp.]
MSDPENKPTADDIDAENARVLAASRKHTRRSFALAALAAAAGYGAFRWVVYSHSDGMQPLPRRRAFQMNAELSRAIFDERALAPTYPVSRAETPRVNGRIGLKQDLLADSWRLQLVGVANEKSFAQYVPDVTAWEYAYQRPMRSDDPDSAQDAASMPAGDEPHLERAGKPVRGLEEAGRSRSTLPAGTPGLLLSMTDILKLPKHELVTQFKCIEGWSQIIHWGGVRMADFIEAYPPARKPDGTLPRYVYMETPNGDYYVGYDLKVCRHPQTLLVTEMDGKPLTQIHGAPLRLHAPTKYGYKQIKRIGVIAYTDMKPDDYWTKLGYDWYAGL